MSKLRLIAGCVLFVSGAVIGYTKRHAIERAVALCQKRNTAPEPTAIRGDDAVKAVRRGRRRDDAMTRYSMGGF